MKNPNELPVIEELSWKADDIHSLPDEPLVTNGVQELARHNMRWLCDRLFDVVQLSNFLKFANTLLDEQDWRGNFILRIDVAS
jgi:hypothetical protein